MNHQELQLSFSVISKEINQLHNELCTIGKISLEKAIRIGELLEQVKKAIRGDFLLWLESHIEFSERTAQRYLRLYRFRMRIKSDNVTDLSLAYQLLTQHVQKAEKRIKKETKRLKHLGEFNGNPDDFSLLCCDIQSARIQSESIDAIITDPPYAEKHLDCFQMLAERASDWLKPGGSLLAMSGQSFLPDVLERICSVPPLVYHWSVCYLTPGGQSVQIFPRHINTFWKPVLWLVKGRYEGSWIGDVTKSNPNDNDKRFHEWGQSESGMADLIERFTLPGQLIVDPFCGGGTTGFVALQLGRRFMGIDKDPNAISKTKERLDSLF